MKTTVIESKEEQREVRFPLLAKTKDSHAVVLFTSLTEGVVLFEEDRGYGIGSKLDGVAPCTNKEVWQILESPVTIKFEF